MYFTLKKKSTPGFNQLKTVWGKKKKKSVDWVKNFPD